VEIHTGKVNREAGRPAVDVPPTADAGARKRASQKAARSGNLAARIFAAARMIAGGGRIGMLAAAGLFAIATQPLRTCSPSEHRHRGLPSRRPNEDEFDCPQRLPANIRRST